MTEQAERIVLEATKREALCHACKLAGDFVSVGHAYVLGMRDAGRMVLGKGWDGSRFCTAHAEAFERAMKEV